jgi:5-methylcytosine-specific restriction endonuclease McrA
MPFLAICSTQGCPELVEPGKTRCSTHTREVDHEIKERSNWRWVYADPRWRALRLQVRAENPYCEEPGCDALGTDVDHIVSVQDGGAPFDRANVQHLCRKHHSSKTNAEVRARGRTRY